METAGHQLLAALDLPIRSNGPGRKYPISSLGPADGYVFFAAELKRAGMIRFGVQTSPLRTISNHDKGKLADAGAEFTNKLWEAVWLIPDLSPDSIALARQKIEILQEILNGAGKTNSSPRPEAASDFVEKAIQIVQATVSAAGGEETRLRKEKLLLLTKAELRDHLDELWAKCAGRCALTGLVMSYETDVPLYPSVDRRDSNGHYERGNLQWVCRFANKWKSDSTDADFKSLRDKIRAVKESNLP